MLLLGILETLTIVRGVAVVVLRGVGLAYLAVVEGLAALDGVAIEHGGLLVVIKGISKDGLLTRCSLVHLIAVSYFRRRDTLGLRGPSELINRSWRLQGE